MASKGKSKLAKTETKFGVKIINLPRFAYDYFVYSAIKFQVPKSCIAVWEGPENDYGCEHDEFCLAMSRLVLRDQLGLRISLYERFMIDYDLEKLTSPKGITDLLQDVFKTSTTEYDHLKMDFIRKAVISLAVASELILFLYSKNCDLYFKELANFWFSYWPHMSKQFGKAGGLDELYRRCDKPNKAKWASFMDKFIKLNCLPYEESVKNKFLDSFYTFIDKYESGLAAIVDLKLFDNRGILQVEALPLPSAPKKIAPQLSHTRNKASKKNATKNPGLGIRPHEELLRDIVADDAAPSQNLPEANTQELGRHRRRMSVQEKVKSSSRLRDDASRIDVSENTGLGISQREDLLRGADDAAPSQNLPEKNPRELARWRRRASAPEKVETSLLVREEATRMDITNLGIRPHEDLLLDVGASVTGETASSQNLPTATPRQLARRRRRSTQQNVKTSLCLKEDAARIDKTENSGLGINLHEELLRNVGVSVADDTTPSQDLPGLSRRDSDRLSSHQKTQKSKFGLCSGVKEGFGKFSRDSSGTKQSSSQMLDVLVTGGTTLSLNLPVVSSQEPATPGEVSSHQQNEESGFTLDFEQDLRRLSLDSSATGQSSTKPDVSAFQNLSGVRQKEPARPQEGSLNQEQGVSDLPSVVEQGSGRLSRNSSRTNEEEPNVSETDDSSPPDPEVSPEDPARAI